MHIKYKQESKKLQEKPRQKTQTQYKGTHFYGATEQKANFRIIISKLTILIKEKALQLT